MLLFIPIWMCIPSNLCLSIMASSLITEAHFHLLTYTGGKYILLIIYKSKVLRGSYKAQALVAHSLWKYREPYSRRQHSTQLPGPDAFSWLFLGSFLLSALLRSHLRRALLSPLITDRGLAAILTAYQYWKGNWKARGKAAVRDFPKTTPQRLAQLRKEP